MKRRDFLVEIGTEELPPKSLWALAESFRDGVVSGLDAAGLAHGKAQAYATPRRLAVLVRRLADAQGEQTPGAPRPAGLRRLRCRWRADARGTCLCRILRRRGRGPHPRDRA